MKDYKINVIEDQLEIRTALLEEGTSDKWWWPKKDHGAWDGPIENWNDFHKDNYFKHVSNYGTVITAGANCGLHTRVFASKFKKVYAFEPDALNFLCLTMNCSEENVFKFQTALGSKPGLCTIIYSIDNGNIGCHSIDEKEGGNIPLTTIDGLNLSECDLIQLDVEGGEERVLDGALQTIEKFKPVIIVETLLSKGEKLLQSMGYTEASRKGGDRIYFYDVEGIMNGT